MNSATLRAWSGRLLLPLFSVLLGLAAGAVAVVLAGASPLDAYGALFQGAFTTRNAFTETLVAYHDAARTLAYELSDMPGFVAVCRNVWTVTSGLPTLSAHIVVDDSCFHDGHAPQLLDSLQACLTGHFDVEHSTFQLEAAAHAGHETGTH